MTELKNFDDSNIYTEIIQDGINIGTITATEKIECVKLFANENDLLFSFNEIIEIAAKINEIVKQVNFKAHLDILKKFKD